MHVIYGPSHEGLCSEPGALYHQLGKENVPWQGNGRSECNQQHLHHHTIKKCKETNSTISGFFAPQKNGNFLLSAKMHARSPLVATTLVTGVNVPPKSHMATLASPAILHDTLY